MTIGIVGSVVPEPILRYTKQIADLALRLLRLGYDGNSKLYHCNQG